MCQFLACALLVVLGELVGQHLEAIADHGVMQSPLGDSGRIELDARIAHAEVDGRTAHSLNLLEGPLVAVCAGGTMHAADAEGGDLDGRSLGSLLRS